jgi:hypothetical protein
MAGLSDIEQAFCFVDLERIPNDSARSEGLGSSARHDAE